MDDVSLRLVGVSGVADLAAEVARWVSDGEVARAALWQLAGGRERRICDPGYPEGGLVAGDVVHALTAAGGEVVGALWLPPDAGVGDRVVVLGRVLARALDGDRTRHRAAVLDAALELLDEGMIVVNADGELLAYGDALERLVGWTADDVRRHGWTNLVYPDLTVRAEVQRGIAALLRGWPSEGLVRTLACKDGSERRVAIWSRALPNPSGGPPALLGVLKDVTSGEEQRRRTAREEGLTQLGRIAGRIAHEYNNLLCAVLGHAELIEAAPDISTTVARRASTIVGSARRGAHLSSRLLAFTGMAQPRPEAVDAVALVVQVVELYRPRMPHRVTVTVDAAVGNARAEVDPTQLQQAVMNLVVNGAESMLAGGVLRVAVDVSALPTEVRYAAPDAPSPGVPMVRIRVIDEGTGFTEAALRHLFEPFFTEKRDGHGIGLAAVRGMLAAHGGAADVQNGVAPAGATVSIWLPGSTRPELQLAGDEGDPAPGPARVWLLDDQEAVLEFSRIALEAAGTRVNAYGSVAALLHARDAAPSMRPDVLVLDVQLADGDGPSALLALRASGIRAPVVWITGHTPESVVLPADLVLRKPYRGADLVDAVRRAYAQSS